MPFKYRQNLKKIGRHLRGRQTDAEKLLWRRLRKRQIKNYQFNRQKPIGIYIVDFFCDKARLVIEIDGGQHYEEKNIEADQKREKYLKNIGLRVVRFTNFDV